MRHFFFHLLLALFGMTACSSNSLNPNSPSSLYEHALEDIEDKQYLLALEKLKDIRYKFPYSEEATQASWKMADVYFLQGQFLEAAASFETFAQLYPNHPKTFYALFKQAESYHHLIPSNLERDLSSAQKALDAYQTFLQYCTDKNGLLEHNAWIQESNQKIIQIQEWLAEKEMMIGDFYYRRNLYFSAKQRYQNIILSYPKTTFFKIAQEKLFKMQRNQELQNEH